MAVASNRVYRIDKIEVDVSKGCLRLGGEEFHLRHKTFRVLLYLIENRERLVTKTELFENLWKDTAVTDDALTKCITDIRKVFGDDTRQPRLLKTVPKSGFRFIGPVEELYPTQSSFIETEITTVEVEFSEEGNGLSQVNSHQSNAFGNATEIRQLIPESGIKRHFNSRFILTAVCLIVVVGLSLIYLVGAIWPSKHASTEITFPKVPGKRSIVVMHFENQSGDRDTDWLREGLADMLITDLSRSNKIAILSRQQLHQLLDDTGRASEQSIRLNEALELGQKSHAELIILGHFARLGQKIRVDVQLHDARTGDLLTTEKLVVDKPDDILSQMDLLSLKIANYLGAVPDKSDHGLASVMTDNVDAYRYYSLALEQAQRHEFPDAVKLLEKAIALDAQFAMAYARLGYVYAVRWQQYDKGKTYLEKAFQMSNRLTDKDRLYIAAWYAHSRMDAPGTIEIYRQLIAAYPTEVEAYQRLGWLLLQAREQPEEALTVINQGLTVDPVSKDSYNLQGSIYTRLGKYSEAVAALQHYVTIAPEDPNALDSLGICHQRFGHYDEAIAAYQRALALNPEAAVAIIHLGNTCFQQGRYRAAIDQYKRYIDVAWNDGVRARGYTTLALVYRKKGERDQVESSIAQALKLDKKTALLVRIDFALDTGDIETAKRLVQPYSETPFWAESSINGFLRFNNYAIGAVALKSGHPEEAINNFKQLINHEPLAWNIDSYEDSLANAYFESGRFDEAIAEYERILKINPGYPLVHYHLGQIFELKMQPDRARAEYEQFLQIWKDADEDIPEVIAARSKVSRSS